jgi:hypothetical protein
VIQIRHGARHFQDSIVGAGREAHAPHGHLQGSLACLVQVALFANHSRRHAGIGISARALNFTGRFHAAQHIRRGFRYVARAQFFPGNRRNLDLDIDAVEERARNFSEVALDDGRRAAAFAGRIAVVSAWAPVQVSTALWSGSTAWLPDERRDRFPGWFHLRQTTDSSGVLGGGNARL